MAKKAKKRSKRKVGRPSLLVTERSLVHGNFSYYFIEIARNGDKIRTCFYVHTDDFFYDNEEDPETAAPAPTKGSLLRRACWLGYHPFLVCA